VGPIGAERVVAAATTHIVLRGGGLSARYEPQEVDNRITSRVGARTESRNDPSSCRVRWSVRRGGRRS
jgi:hypothetical protein